MSTSLAEQKQALRHQIRAWRDAVPASRRAEASRRAAGHLARHRLFLQAAVVALFAGLPHEVDPLQIVGFPQARGKRLLLPRTRQAPRRLSWHLLRCQAQGEPQGPQEARQALQPGAFGVLEPEGEEVDAQSVGLWVLPGLAFDVQGGRLGYGGGYYDRALASSRAPRLGFGFARQVVDQVPQEDHDLRVDGIVTDSGVRLVTGVAPV